MFLRRINANSIWSRWTRPLGCGAALAKVCPLGELIAGEGDKLRTALGGGGVWSGEGGHPPAGPGSCRRIAAPGGGRTPRRDNPDSAAGGPGSLATGF